MRTVRRHRFRRHRFRRHRFRRHRFRRHFSDAAIVQELHYDCVGRERRENYSFT